MSRSKFKHFEDNKVSRFNASFEEFRYRNQVFPDLTEPLLNFGIGQF